MAGNWFGRRPVVDRSIQERIRQWASAALADDPDIRFSVNEIICRDPSCPGTETVILVMAPGVRTRALKIVGAMADVTAQDVQHAVAVADRDA